MDSVLERLHVWYAYLDDILVTPTKFERLNACGVTINPSECIFKEAVVKFLGYNVKFIEKQHTWNR